MGETLISLMNLSKRGSVNLIIVTDSIKTVEVVCEEAELEMSNVDLVEAEKLGVYAAMNEGIRSSRSPYFMFINSGDTIYESGFNTILNILNHHGGHLCCDYFTSASNSYSFRASEAVRFGQKHTVHQAYFFNRSKTNGLLHDLSYKICADYDYVRKLNPDDFEIIHTPVVVYDLTTGISKDNHFSSILEAYRIDEKHRKSLINNLILVDKMFKYLMVESLKVTGMLMIALRVKTFLRAMVRKSQL